jgi:hypothetical protein
LVSRYFTFVAIVDSTLEVLSEPLFDRLRQDSMAFVPPIGHKSERIDA